MENIVSPDQSPAEPGQTDVQLSVVNASAAALKTSQRPILLLWYLVLIILTLLLFVVSYMVNNIYKARQVKQELWQASPSPSAIQMTTILTDICKVTPTDQIEESEKQKYPQCEADSRCFWQFNGGKLKGYFSCCPKIIKEYQQSGKEDQLMREVPSLARCFLMID